MKSMNELVEGYGTLLVEIKQRIRSAQYEALKAVNKELISLYWDGTSGDSSSQSNKGKPGENRSSKL
jgi:hypothetical protein